MEELTAPTPFLSGRTRARAVMFLLLACAAVSLFSIFSAYLQINLISGALAGGEVTEEQATANDMREGVAGLLWIIVFLATAITFLLWIHRAYRNLPALGNPKQRLEYSPGWAVGWFFIPFANIVYPFKVMREIWQKSDPRVRNTDDFMWQDTATPPLLAAWWGMWLASGVVSRLYAMFTQNAKTPESMLWATKFGILADIFAIIAAFLAFLVVKGVDARQEERSHHVRFAESLPPPPPIYAPHPVDTDTSNAVKS